MNLFEAAVGNFNNDDNSKSGNFQTVDTRVDATRVGLYQPSIKRLKEVGSLPNNTTEQSINKAENEKNTLSARNFKLAQLAKHRIGIVREIARGVDIQMNYQTAVMDTNMQIEAKTAQYGVKVGQYEMTKKSLEQGYESYMNELKGGAEETAAFLNGW